MKIFLLFPPQWTSAMPHLALPTLTAFLRGEGIEVVQRDLNAEVYDQFLTRRFLEGALDRLRQVYSPDGNLKVSRRFAADPQMVRWALSEGPALAREVESAKGVIRSQAFYDGPTCRDAFLTLVSGLRLASLPFYPSTLDFNSFNSAYPVDNSSRLLQAVRDPEFNPFLDVFKAGVIKDIQREQPDIVGISIPTMGQMLAGMTAAFLVKKAGIKCHVTVGGPHITMLREQIAATPQLFNLIDSAVTGAGEYPLLALAKALEGQHTLAEVPNLIYREPAGAKNSKPSIRTNPPDHNFDHRMGGPAHDESGPKELLPDFDGLDLKRYLTPDVVLPLLTAHGCYHGVCAFCNVGFGWDNSYRQLQAEHIVEQMLELNRKYGARHIFFADEAITPRNLKYMSNLLIEKGSPVDWTGCTRFERSLSDDILTTLGQDGCRMLLFGLETASSPIVSAMDKGTQLETISRILRQGRDAGIWNHTFFFFGFPGETIENAQDTVNFLYAHQELVHSASMGTFLLERYAPVHLYAEKFGVTRVIEKPDKDLAIYFDYEVAAGMNEEMAEEVVSNLLTVLPDKPFGQYYLIDAYRLLYSSYLHRQGKTLPPWLVPESQSTPAES
jgi:anaerobic magnesium-protoporphyrin IX monomethyl ester cyclase